jgi:REP element-mobilizing transposase RayT
MPHWTQAGATYFVTFRLGDSIPVHLQRRWLHEREIWMNWHPEPWSAEVDAEYRARFTEKMEFWLDAGHGDCHLKRPEIRRQLFKHVFHFDGESYDLDACVIMPNHVHLLIKPRDGHDLFNILGGIKGTSARTCNRLLGRTGTTLWMGDSYNRIVRDGEELLAFRDYIRQNPIKAKLREDEFTLVMNDVLTLEP